MDVNETGMKQYRHKQAHDSYCLALFRMDPAARDLAWSTRLHGSQDKGHTRSAHGGVYILPHLRGGSQVRLPALQDFSCMHHAYYTIPRLWPWWSDGIAPARCDCLLASLISSKGSYPSAQTQRGLAPLSALTGCTYVHTSQVVLGNDPLAVRTGQPRLNGRHPGSGRATLDEQLRDVLPPSHEGDLQGGICGADKGGGAAAIRGVGQQP